MRIKFKGEWYDIQCFNITKNDGTAFITKDYESSIEDIEINGSHLAASVESDVISVYPKGRVTEGKYDVMKVTAEGVTEAAIRKKGCWEVGDEVMTIDPDGKIFHGKISEMIGDGMCQVMNRDGDTLTGVLLSKLVDDSDGADPNYTAAQINAMQAEYWQHQNDWRGGCKLDNNLSDGNAIDWEQRQFFLAAQIYAHKDCLYPDCMTEAKNFIDHYREETKL
jgi:hypothetical protein